MPSIADLLHYLKDPTQLIVAVGMFGIPAIIFIETGLLFPMLPGDSLLVTAGLLASQPDGPVPLNVWTLGIMCSAAAIAGNTTGFFIGRRAGKALFAREDSRFFKRAYIEQAHAFYETHGGKTIFIAQFMPIVRTFAPVVAGIAEMRYRRFAIFNFTGGILWITSMTLIGYFLAKAVPGIEKKIEYVIAVVIFLSILPIIIKYIQHKFGKASAS